MQQRVEYQVFDCFVIKCVPDFNVGFLKYFFRQSIKDEPSENNSFKSRFSVSSSSPKKDFLDNLLHQKIKVRVGDGVKFYFFWAI